MNFFLFQISTQNKTSAYHQSIKMVLSIRHERLENGYKIYNQGIWKSGAPSKIEKRRKRSIETPRTIRHALFGNDVLVVVGVVAVDLTSSSSTDTAEDICLFVVANDSSTVQREGFSRVRELRILGSRI